VRVSWVEAGAGELWLENRMDKIKVAGGYKEKRKAPRCLLPVCVRIKMREKRNDEVWRKRERETKASD